MPTPAPVIGATLAMMRSTSAKASVTSAKYEPRRPERKRQRADDGADQRAGRDADREARPGVDAVAHLQDRRHIGAGAEEGRVAERILPAIAAEHVPALPDQRDQQRDDQEVEHDVRLRDERHDAKRGDHKRDLPQAPSCALSEQPARAEQQHQDEDDEDADLAERLAEIERPDRLSTTPMNRPPTSAPATEPMPPSTTIVKATSTKALPTCGLT